MELQRTCNAGVLLKLDGVSILLDGLCEGLDGYYPTPASFAAELLETPPDVLLFTHSHPDHYSEALLLPYKTQKLRPVLGPESFPEGKIRVGEVTVTAVVTRHLGKTEPNLSHCSFVIEGSQCVWFMGDASPIQMKQMTAFPKPDVLIAPYAYANTPTVWEMTKAVCRGTVVIVHLPDREKDTFGLWRQVNSATDGESCLWIPTLLEHRDI